MFRELLRGSPVLIASIATGLEISAGTGTWVEHYPVAFLVMVAMLVGGGLGVLASQYRRTWWDILSGTGVAAEVDQPTGSGESHVVGQISPQRVDPARHIASDRSAPPQGRQASATAQRFLGFGIVLGVGLFVASLFFLAVWLNRDEPKSPRDGAMVGAVEGFEARDGELDVRVRVKNIYPARMRVSCIIEGSALGEVVLAEIVTLGVVAGDAAVTGQYQIANKRAEQIDAVVANCWGRRWW